MAASASMASTSSRRAIDVAQRSSIDRLEPEVRGAVVAAIERGCTIDEIVEQIGCLGAKASRSAVGRYTKQYRELAETQRDLDTVASAFSRDFKENPHGRLAIQLLNSLITRSVLPSLSGDAEPIDFKDLHFLARAVKDATSAAKTDVDRDAKVREEAVKQERSRAAAQAENTARAAGASEETIRRVRAAILGIDTSPKGDQP